MAPFGVLPRKCLFIYHLRVEKLLAEQLIVEQLLVPVLT
jgi:hypothetical protein